MARDDRVPLLSGTAAAQARKAVAAIVSSLEGLRDSASRHPSLADGGPGIALLYRYLALSDDASQTTPSDEVVRETLGAVDSNRLGPALYGGITGPAWTAAHLLEKESADTVDGPVDEALTRGLDQHGWGGPFDLIGGCRPWRLRARAATRPSGAPAARGGHRSPRRARRADRRRDRLADDALSLSGSMPSAIPMAGTISGWRTGPQVWSACSPRPKRRASARTDRRIARRSRQVAAGAEAAPRPGQSLSIPGRAGRAITTRRTAWCYGDPGIAVALLLAARAASRADWEEAALDTARAASRRSPRRPASSIAAFATGPPGSRTSSTACFSSPGDDEFADAARFWFAWTLEQRRPGGDVGGFLSLQTGQGGADGWRPAPGFLTGAAGIGLALLAATSRIEPGWDRVMLLSTGPSSQAGAA